MILVLLAVLHDNPGAAKLEVLEGEGTRTKFWYGSIRRFACTDRVRLIDSEHVLEAIVDHLPVHDVSDHEQHYSRLSVLRERYHLIIITGLDVIDQQMQLNVAAVHGQSLTEGAILAMMLQKSISSRIVCEARCVRMELPISYHGNN